MKKYFIYFIYISLTFLLYTLFKADFLKIPVINNYFYLGVSFFCLFLGFIFDGISWTKLVKHANYNVAYKQGISSTGLSVFGKYIPGKVWVILGRAEYLARKYNISRKDLSSLSLNAQFISLWTGLILGTIGIITISKLGIYGLSILSLLIILSLIIFTKIFHQLIEYLFIKILKRKIELPRLSFLKILKVLPWFVLNWLFWCVSFYFLASSLVEQQISLNIAWGFGLAGSLGILAVIAPGGIGVREGLLIGYLLLNDLNIQDATTIAVTSRLWFLIGEIFIFSIALVLDKKKE